MKKLISSITVALFATVALASAASNDLEAKEKALWQAFKNKKPDVAKTYLSPNLRSVYAEGMSTFDDEMATMQKLTMKSFSFSDFKTVMLNADTAMCTYKVKVKATADGKDISGTYNAGSVWLKVNGNWMGVFHTEVKAEMMPKS